MSPINSASVRYSGGLVLPSGNESDAIGMDSPLVNSGIYSSALLILRILRYWANVAKDDCVWYYTYQCMTDAKPGEKTWDPITTCCQSQSLFRHSPIYSTFTMELFISNGKRNTGRCVLHVGTDWTNERSRNKVIYPPWITIKIAFFSYAHRCTICWMSVKCITNVLNQLYMGGWSPTSVPLVGLVYPFLNSSSQYWPLDKRGDQYDDSTCRQASFYQLDWCDCSLSTLSRSKLSGYLDVSVLGYEM